MATKRKPLNTTISPAKKPEFGICHINHCKNVARHWIKVCEHTYVPICTPCKNNIPKELLQK